MNTALIITLVTLAVLAIVIVVLYFLGKKAQIMSLVCDEKIFDSVPVKKEVKAVVSGIYITGVKGLHGKAPQAPAKKKGFFRRALEKAQEKTGAKPLK